MAKRSGGWDSIIQIYKTVDPSGGYCSGMQSFAARKMLIPPTKHSYKSSYTQDPDKCHVVKPATIRTVLSLAVSRQWPIHQLDVKNAFLYSHLKETVYMHQPPRFTDSAHSDYVCLLQKLLYGLKQAPELGFNDFLAMTPIDTEKKLGPEGSSVTDPTLYRSLVGSLLYLTFTRPDLSYVVQQLCLYMHDSREPHLNAMKRVLRYLRGTTNLGLQLFRSTTSQLIAYFDADWAGCPATCQSTSGYCVFLGDNLLTCATHSSIGRSPFSVVYQKSPRCVVDLVKQPKVHEYSSAPARLANDSQVGEMVMVFLRREQFPVGKYNKLQPKK
ncbi:ribonuclease H-like domain-containing protein [Tanacetum coccineum]